MNVIKTIEELESLYGKASQGSLNKVTPVITPLYRKWIEASRFVVVATAGGDRCDASPRGDTTSPVKIADAQTILLPDWRGNNRLDTLRNIVNDGRISLMFMANGSANVVRVNGNAVLTADTEVTGQFARNDSLPKTVVVVTVREAYFQCAKAIMRSELGSGSSLAAAV